MNEQATASGTLAKAATGITGLDDITFGGFPSGRPTLICGSAGCGKTLFGLTFLVNGATLYGEPGVFVSFEERAEDLAANVASLGYDLDRLIAEEKLAIDHIRVERSEIEESGEYDLEGLFIRLGFAIDSIGAKRIVLDTIETLFSGLDNTALLRSEIRRLFGWLKDRGITAVITGERGDGALTRQGLEEYVSDCVILLDNRVIDQITTRRLRVVKYRGSAHGTNEYPFLVDDQGISVLPVTSADLSYAASHEIAPTGIAGLDLMLERRGLFKGSSVLLSGVAGTGKTTFTSFILDAACNRGERCLAFVFEESGQQVARNAASVGLDLKKHIASGLLRFKAARPTLFGLETHLAGMHRDVEQFKPNLVVIDPVSSLEGPAREVQSTLLRMVDMMKSREITAVFTSLRREGSLEGDSADLGLSSLMDVWIKLLDIEANGERTRTLYVIKARGMSHSNQIREFQITSNGIKLIEPYVGTSGVLTGTARTVREAEEAAVQVRRRQEIERRRRDNARNRASIERQIEELRSSLDVRDEEELILLDEDKAREAVLDVGRDELTSRRGPAS